MITTVTLNASIDKAYRLAQEAVPGTVMRVSEVRNSAGGKGLNTSRAIVTCGEQVMATGFVGGNNGRMLCELAERDGVPCDFVHTASETRCCINAIEPDGRSTEFLEPGQPVSADDVAAVERKVAKLAAQSDVVTMNGSVPAGCGDGIYRQLIEVIHAAGKPALLDTSGKLLVGSLDARPDVIKPNTDEIAAILGHRPSSLDEVVAAAREVRERHGVGCVIVSLGGDGSVMSCAEGEFRGISPKIEVVNTVGSGDTLVGAFAVATARGLALPERLRFGMACASANCLTPNTGNFEMSVAEELLAQTTVARL